MTTTYYSDGTSTITDRPELTRADILRSSLVIHCTAYDAMIKARAARNARVYHNPYALGLYFEAVDRVVQSLEFEGMTLAQALHENFTGHMLKYLMTKVTKEKL
jgi:hypothetical protein